MMLPYIIENNLPTSSVYSRTGVLGGELLDFDLILRMKSDNRSQGFQISCTNTQTVKDSLSTYLDRFQQDIGLLRSVILWQKRTIDYQALYTALLLNSLSDEEFEEESEKFTVHQKNVEPEKIASDVERLYSLIGINFDTSDYADFFQCDQQNVMNGLNLIQHSSFQEMLPSSSKEA